MFELIETKLTPKTIWNHYRSLTLGRPVVKEQAYNAAYPWIEFDGVYYHRSLETVLTLLHNNIPIPEVYQEDLELVNYIRCAVYEHDRLLPTRYGMAKPKDTTLRELILSKQDELIIYGKVALPFKQWKKPWIYSNVFNIGADMVKTEQECVALTQSRIMVCSPSMIDESFFRKNNVNWNNVWVWED